MLQEAIEFVNSYNMVNGVIVRTGQTGIYLILIVVLSLGVLILFCQYELTIHSVEIFNNYLH